MICQHVTLSGEAEWPKVADAVIEARRHMVALLQEHPEGLSPVQTQQLLGLEKSLGSTRRST